MAKSVLIKEFETTQKFSAHIDGSNDYSHEYVWWLERELLASRDSRILSAVPSEEELTIEEINFLKEQVKWVTRLCDDSQKRPKLIKKLDDLIAKRGIAG